CGDHGDSREFGQDAEFARRPGAQDTTADVQDGAFGVGDHPGGFAHLFAVRFGHGPVAGGVQAVGPDEAGVVLQGVLGDVDQDGAGTSAGGDVEGLGADAGAFVGGRDEGGVDGERNRDAAEGGLVGGGGADPRGGDAAGASAGGDVDGLGDDAGDFVGVLVQEVVFGDRHRDAADVGFLEGVGADRR